MGAQDPKDQWATWVHKVQEATLDPQVRQDHKEALVNLALKDKAETSAFRASKATRDQRENRVRQVPRE